MERSLLLRKATRIPITIYHLWIASLLLLLGFGLIGGARVLIYGLQVTGLNDRVPWGMWITQDLSSIGLGAGAFTLSALVYLFRVKRFEPLVRAAVFVGFLGYTSAMLALFLDIGRPDRFWHPLVFWNVHSVLWEITWAVVLYSTVLVLEFLPILLGAHFFDRLPRLRKLGHLIHKAAPIFAAIGIGISMIHQSSLGATYGVLSGRAIWYKPTLPVMFILSAIGGGISLTLLATLITSKVIHKTLIPQRVKGEIALLVGFIQLSYLYLKLWDWLALNYYSHTPGTASVLERLGATTPYTQTFWWVEIILGGILPVLILLSPSTRKNDRLLILSLAMIVLAVVMNRWNVTLSGLVAPPEWSPGILGDAYAVPYIPTWTEIAVTVGILAYSMLAFTLGVRYLPIFPHVKRKEEIHKV